METYHLGIETGGTTCKVGMMKDLKSMAIEKRLVVNTESPEVTINKLCDWINSQPETFSSIGVAAFGPLDLNKKSKKYGSVTTTPKAGWSNFHILKHLLNGINEDKKTKDFRVVFDTDCNVLAKFEI